MTKKSSKKNKGFTLIELLVVIAIIGILAGIVLVSLSGTRAKARDAQRQSDIRQTSLAMEMYYSDEQAYATSSTLLVNYLSPFPESTVTLILNTSDTQDYCAYSELEAGGYFVASPNGVRARTAIPTLGDCQ